MLRALPPERRRRGDRVAAAALVVVVVAAVVAVATTGDVAGTASRPAAEPVAAPPPAAAAPAAFAEAWRAPSGATPAPLVAGPAVVTGDGGTVSGRDAATGEERWSYARDLPLCTVGSGFPSDAGGGPATHVLALYGTGPLDGPGTWCSELTMLGAATGAREGARNPDARPGVRLLADDAYVLAVDPEHLEAWRYDLVRTVEYGDVPAQEQADRQPRPECAYGSAAQGGRRTAVVERCPDEDVDRLTVLVTDGEDGADQPEVAYSVLLPGAGAVVVATTEGRTAVALPGPDRLLVLDGAGTVVGTTQLDLDGGLPGADPPGGVAVTSSDGRLRYWWSGSDVVALDEGELAPVWTLPGAVGPPVRYGADLLVPVPEGLAVVDAGRGLLRRTLPVRRDDPAGPVVPAALGEVLLEQRGGEVVALLPG